MIGRKIGKGRTAEVYQYGKDKIVKLFYTEFESIINKEYENAKFAYSSGIKTPKPYEKIEIDSRKGIIYEKFNGIDLGKAISKRPFNAVEFGARAASIHAEINAIETDCLIDQEKMIINRLSGVKCLTEGQKEKIIKYTSELPSDNKLCHGDLHVENYIYNEDSLYAIDWITAYSGHPAGDIARMLLLMKSPVIKNTLPPIIGNVVVKMLAKYTSSFLDRYTELTGIDLKTIEEFMLPAAAVRLGENVPYEKEWLMDIVNSELERL